MRFDTRIFGIPCQVNVTHFYREKPNRTANSDLDYSGYVEMDWHVLDTKGRYAAWLERKITDEIREQIEEEICEYH